MKKMLCALLAAACLMMGSACADGPEAWGRDGAENALTEVYGYTVEETTAFHYETTAEDGRLNVRFWPLNRPEWVYTAAFDANTNKYIEGTSPFTENMRLPDSYPGEAAVREVVRNVWEKWEHEYGGTKDRNELLKEMHRQGIQPSSAVLEGVITGNRSDGELVLAFFENCYGMQMGWNQAVQDWYEQTLAYTGEKTEAAPAYAEGIVTYTYQPTDKYVPVTVTRFVGEAPDAVQQMLKNPNLAGWQPLCGVLEESPLTETQLRMEDQGMLVFEKDGQRLLVALERREEQTEWTLHPISLTAIRTGVDMYIEPGSERRSYSIVYRLSETETERFLVRTGNRRMENVEGKGCSLLEYSRMDAAKGEGFWLDIHAGESQAVVYHADGRVQEEEISTPLPHSLEWLDVEAFPTTLTQCWQYEAASLPRNCAVSGGVHLRATKSSRGRDLGMYEDGVLVKILGQEPGEPHPWYRVQVGSREGYMCSIYVHDDAQSYANNRPPVGQTTREVRLKNGPGLLAGTVQKLPAGAKFYVLADCGSKLHVILTEDGNAPMPLEGVDGYLSADDVSIALTSLQLSWQN